MSKKFAICASINKTVFTVQHIFQNHSLFRYGSLIQNVRLKLHYLCKSIGTEGDRLISGGPTNMLRKSLFAKALMQDSADIGRMQKFWASCELAWVTWETVNLKLGQVTIWFVVFEFDVKFDKSDLKVLQRGGWYVWVISYYANSIVEFYGPFI